jgi:hypothetical protein
MPEKEIKAFADKLRMAAEHLESSLKTKAAARRARLALNEIKKGVTQIKKFTMEVHEK